MRTQSSPPAANTSLVQLAAPVNELQHQVIPNPNKVPGLRVCSTPPGVDIPESRRQFRSGHNYRQATSGGGGDNSRIMERWSARPVSEGCPHRTPSSP